MGKYRVENKISKKTWYFTGYQKNLLEWRIKYMFYPRVVHIETSAGCNAKCVFCPHSSMSPKAGGRMSDALIDKILTELQSIPPFVKFTITPVRINEPLLEPRLWDIIARVQNEIKNANINLVSNLSLLNDCHVEKLVTTPIMNALNISLNEYRPDVYEKVMGLEFSRTVENIGKLHEWRKRGKMEYTVSISKVADGTEHDALFLKWCYEKFPLFKAVVTPRFDWLGGVSSDIHYRAPNIGCHNWSCMSINHTGTVDLCCCDYKSEYIYGDVNKQHVLEIYNSPEYRNFRENTLSRFEVEPCRRCTCASEPLLTFKDIS